MAVRFDSAREAELKTQIHAMMGRRSVRAIGDALGASRSYVHRVIQAFEADRSGWVSPERAAYGSEPLPAGSGLSCGAIGLRAWRNADGLAH